jgi:hypothetical protein
MNLRFCIESMLTLDEVQVRKPEHGGGERSSMADRMLTMLRNRKITGLYGLY